MARIRTIKPEFPQSESMGRVSRDARLLFIELWTVADDLGRLRGNSRMLASLLFPYDDDAPGLIEGWLAELEREQCIGIYEVDGNTYVQVLKWQEHQKVDKPSPSRLPEYSREFAKPRESSPRTKDLGPRTGTKDLDRDLGRDLDRSLSARADRADEPLAAVFEHWKTILNHPTAKLDDKRRKAISGALRIGYTVDQLKAAIDGCSRTPHNMGQNDRHTVYDDLGLILRDADHIDRFIRNSLRSTAAVAVDAAEADRRATVESALEYRRRMFGTVIDGEVAA